MHSSSSCALLAVALAALLAGAGCEPQRPAVEDRLVRVCVSIPPQGFVLERLGGERVEVDVLVGPGQSPATYEPTPRQMVGLERADLYVRIGVPFEDTLMQRISSALPDLEIVDMRDGITLRELDQHAHDADHDHSHSHGRLDPHLWLDPALLAISAKTVAEALGRHDAESAEIYEANLVALEDDLEALDREIQQTLAPVRGRKMLVFHPAFGYFADAYGLEQIAIEVLGGEPGPRQLQQVIESARAIDVGAVFVQPEFARASARAIAEELQVEVETLDPLARDYLQNMREIAARVLRALDGGEEGSDG